MRKVIAILIAVCFVFSMTAAAAAASESHSKHPMKYLKYTKSSKITKTMTATQQANLNNNQNIKVDNYIINIGSNDAWGKCGVKAGNNNYVKTTATNTNKNEVSQAIVQQAL